MFPHRPVHESLLVAGQLVSNGSKVIINSCMSNMYTRCCCLLAGYWITTMAERPGHGVKVKTQKVKMTNGNVQVHNTGGLP